MSELILIVEDEKDVRHSIDEILTTSGYEVMQAENGKSAIDISNEYYPDLVISDIMMPGLDGYQLLEYFQKKQNMENIPFMFLSAKAHENDVRFGMNQGADDYLTKPFRAKELIKSVQTRLNKKKKWQKSFAKIQESFTHAVQHELRTPLVPVLGFSDLITDDFNNLTKNEIYDMVKTIKSGAVNLHSKIEKSILLSAIHSELNNIEDVKTLRQERTNPSKDTIIQLSNNIAKNYNRFCDVKFEMHDKGEVLKISEYYFTIIINELIENACKYSESGTPIIIKTQKTKEYYLIIFKNNGQGLTKKQIRSINVFQKFLNKDPFTPGSGLGLYMLKEIVKVFGGYLNIESEIGKSTEISVQIPIEDETINNFN